MKQSVYKDKVVETIDLTPTWEAVLPSLIAVIQDGSADGKRLATEELRRMAAIADKYVELTKAEATSMKEAKNIIDECDTAFAVLFIGADHGITPQANKACKEAADKVKNYLETYKTA